MRRSLDQENLRQRLRDWQKTALPSHREERIQDALNKAQAELDRRDGSKPEDERRYRGSSHGTLPSSLPWFLRWRGRLIGTGVMGGLAALVVVAALTLLHGNQARFPTESSAASSGTAHKSTDTTSSSSGSSSEIQAQAASHTHSPAASGAVPLWHIPGNITKVEVHLNKLSKSNGVSSSEVQSRVITGPGAIETLRKAMNGLKPVPSGEQGCAGDTGKTATLTFITNGGKRIPAKVDGNCGYITLGGVKLQDSQIWTQLMSIMKQKN